LLESDFLLESELWLDWLDDWWLVCPDDWLECEDWPEVLVCPQRWTSWRSR